MINLLLIDTSDSASQVPPASHHQPSGDRLQYSPVHAYKVLFLPGNRALYLLTTTIMPSLSSLVQLALVPAAAQAFNLYEHLGNLSPHFTHRLVPDKLNENAGSPTPGKGLCNPPCTDQLNKQLYKHTILFQYGC